jgi:hypothetical protein
MRRALIGLLALVLCIPGFVHAQSLCGSTRCVYLPLVRRPVPASFPSGGAVAYQPVVSFYVDSLHKLHVIGEVTNQSAENQFLPRVTANFFDAKGKLLATSSSFIVLTPLPPNTTTCYQVLLQEPAGWASIQFEPITPSPTTQRPAALSVFNDSGTYDTSSHTYTVIGQVRNDDAVKLVFVTVLGTLYNAENVPVACGVTYVNSMDLTPGQTSSFMLQVTDQSTAAARYRLQASGNIP